ncbi:IS200/IS605 family transposase [Spirulina subsalsa FACHB-351]|uniref:IS200/IS605 family transposase n=1 Tax=Spirulina subsalsa FACHB-351 TaxID=234711 RepID=A0ABT3L7J2_9CYAN|nr:IS200/IS605 family transposase [Spirulina subsalsa]MCW6037477.1 IS200/IS605 family transposase [Spirulina subsalsa FACHB-351]
MTTQFRRERHSVTDLRIHLVCVTKYRRSVFTTESLGVIEKSFQTVAKKMDFQIIEFNGEGNHVHSLIEYPPKLSVSQIVNALKGVSSRRYGQAGYKKPHKEALWSPSYFAISVGGASLEVLKQYIRNQEKPS